MDLSKHKYLALVHGDDSSGSWLVSIVTDKKLSLDFPFHFVSELDNRSYRYDPTSAILFYGEDLRLMQTGWRIAGFGRIPAVWDTADIRYIVVNFFRTGEYRDHDNFIWGVSDV